MTVPRATASDAFLELLRLACRQIDAQRMLLPVSSDGANRRGLLRDRVHRERVYCYELYHQVRLLEATDLGRAAGSPEYVISGEIDKAGLDVVIKGGRHKPDLVWHVAGRSDYNAVVVEVKQAAAIQRAGIRKDLETLADFITADDRAYEEGVLLLYGANQDDRDLLRGIVLREADRAFKDREPSRPGLSKVQRERIRVLLHPAAHAGVLDLGDLTVPAQG